MSDEPKSSLAELRERSEASEAQAKKDKEALLTAAVEEVLASTAYGHLSAVARRAGIASQYLRTLVEERHPGWLDEAAEQREAAKAAERESKTRTVKKGRGSGKGAAAA